MNEEEKNNRFNQRAAKWHGLLWLWIIMLVCLGWSLLFSGCSTKRCLASDSLNVSESLVVRSTSSSVDSSRHDSTIVISSEKNHSKSVRDSVFVSQIIEKTTIIRQDSSGRELSRETNTTITNNRDRLREIDQMFNDVSSSNTNVNDKQVSKVNTSNDSISNKSKEKKTKETVYVEQTNIWDRIANLFRFLWGLIKFCFAAVIIGVVIYVVGGGFVQLYQLAKKIHRNIMQKRGNNGKDGENGKN